MTLVVLTFVFAVALWLSVAVLLKGVRGHEIPAWLSLVWGFSVALSIVSVLQLTGVIKP
jgi:hypothetical protein